MRALRSEALGNARLTLVMLWDEGGTVRRRGLVYGVPFRRSSLLCDALAVIATPVGGQSEMLEDGVNVLTFPPADAGALAECIVRLRRDPALRERLATAGQRAVLERFTLQRMVDEMEAWLSSVCA